MSTVPRKLAGWVKELLTALHVSYDHVANTLYRNAVNRKRVLDLKFDVVSTV